MISRSRIGCYRSGISKYSTILFGKPITNGIISVSVTVLSLHRFDGSVRLGFLDSTCPVPKLDDALGYNVQNSLSLFSFVGHVSVCNESTGLTGKTMNCQMEIKEGDCIRMELNMNSNPRIVQFFVNGSHGSSFVSGLPPSIRIGLSLSYQTTSIRFDRITHQTQPTPITSDMTEYTWE